METGNTSEVRVTALIVTYRRRDLVLRTLGQVFAQTTPVTSAVVVDNAAEEELAELVTGSYERTRYVAAPENLGPGGGFSLGLQSARHDEVDWYWLLDDDSPPALNALEEALNVAAHLGAGVGAVGLRGGHIRCGRIRHDLKAGSANQPTRADFLLMDGALVRAEAIRQAGVPRADFFIMMEDLEYSIRIREAGFDLYVRPHDGSEHLYQGAGAPWRGYYQSRNHLRMAIERRSMAWLWGWTVREVGIHAHHIRHRRWASSRFRLIGAVDAIRGRMGRTVQP